MRKTKLFGLVPLAALASLAPLAFGQIIRLDLEQMVAAADGAVYGEITASVVEKRVDPEHGDLFFTTITVEGRSLADGTSRLVELSFHGGFLNEEEGVYNSEAPSADDVKVGNRVVAFHSWMDDAGAGFAGNFLYAAHGGIYRTAEGPSGAVVLGRGDGYAIDRNVALETLDTRVAELYRLKTQDR